MLKNNLNQNKLILILILSSIIVLTGCQSSGSVSKYHVGTDGLSIAFSPSDPKSIYEGENFGTSIVISNAGSYDIDKNNPAILKTSFDDYRLEFVKSKDNLYTQNVILNGKSANFPKGDELTAEFYFNSLRLTELREGAKTNINYNLCYPYDTELTTVTCIDTKLANRDESAAACASETYDGGTGQGAPIVITKIVPEIMLQTDYVRPQFKIYIENKGTGYVTNVNTCTLTDINDRNSSGRVSVYAELSGKKLECGPDNLASLRLVDSESFIRCYLPNTEKGYARTNKNYLTPLTVKLAYTYTMITSQSIEIKRDDTLEQLPSSGCDSYQIKENNLCVDKCQYCINNPQDSRCKENIPITGFEFTQNFACTCTTQQCDTKLAKGNCIKGYCAGGLECCSANNCDTYQVEINGKCLDKCEYCKINPTDNVLCPSVSTFNFTSASCKSISQLECENYSKNKTCIKGYCGGTNSDRYCTNII